METTIPDSTLSAILARLAAANGEVALRYPGDSGELQPVHTVYGGAHLFVADSAVKLGAAAVRALNEYAPDAAALAEAFQLDPSIATRIYPRIVDKLQRDAVEDLRIDFEDGFGHRPDAEEDEWARTAGARVAAGMAQQQLPRGIGIRIKSLSEELKRRSLRTLDLFVSRLVADTNGLLPARFAITLPKITSPAQVEALAEACEALEQRLGLASGSLRIELMVETTQTIFAADGTIALPRLVAAGRGRVVGAHFGTYDYTAGLAITAAHQRMQHPGCDFAKQVMQVSLAGTPIHLSDGATNIMPIGPHRAAAGEVLSDSQRAANRAVVHHAWRLHAADVRHSLETGFYQGWDLHPAQLPSRYAAVYAFFVESLDAASERLENFVAKAAQATLVGDVFDDAATGQGLLNYFLRAMSCGAISEQEATALSGLTADELRGRSFLDILESRKKK